MIITKTEIEYCMDCGKENPQDREICECGGRSFIYGNNFTYTKENGIVCNCGNNEFKFLSHLNMTPFHEYVYLCDKCKNKIGRQTFSESY